MPGEVRWYFSENGEVKGPLPESELVRLARAGRVLPTEYILREGHQEWLSAQPLVENAHALPLDGEVPTARVATQPDLVINDEDEGRGGVPPAVWVLVVIGALSLIGFAWYMLGPMSPVLGNDDDAAQAEPDPRNTLEDITIDAAINPTPQGEGGAQDGGTPASIQQPPADPEGQPATPEQPSGMEG